jgi:hypothetical protein
MRKYRGQRKEKMAQTKTAPENRSRECLQIDEA